MSAPMFLCCVQGKERGQRFPLVLNASVIIGRDPGTDGIQCLDTMASRTHVSVSVNRNMLEICDLGSANGSRLNGQKLTGTTRMHPGDILSIGSTSLLFEDPHRSSQTRSATRIQRQHHNSQRLKARQQTQLQEGLHSEPEARGEEGMDTEKNNIAALYNSPPLSNEPLINHDMLIAVLATMPLAIAIFNDDDHVLIVNDRMKQLCDIDIAVGKNARILFAHFNNRLYNPGTLAVLLESSHPDPLRLQGNNTTARNSFSAWSHVSTDRKILYISENDS